LTRLFLFVSLLHKLINLLTKFYIMNKLLKFSIFLAILTVAVLSCKKEPEKNPGGGGDPDNPPGNNTVPPVAGITTTDAGKVAETVFVEYYKKLTQVEQDIMEAAVEGFRKKSDTKGNSDDNTANDLATIAALLAGDGYSPDLIGNFLATAVLKSENNPYALYNFGGFLRMTGKNKEALPVLQQAAKLAPTSAPILSALGCALFDNGDVAGAEVKFNEALKKDPNCKFANEGLIAVYAQKNTREDLVPLFSNYVNTLRDFAPVVGSNVKKNIDKGIQSQIKALVRQYSVDDEALAPLVPEKPSFLKDVFDVLAVEHVTERPRAPSFRYGCQEQYAGSAEMIYGECGDYGTNAACFGIAATFGYQAEVQKWASARPQSRRGWVGFTLANVENIYQIITEYFITSMKAVKELACDKISDWLTKRGFYDIENILGSYGITEADFKSAVQKDNFVLDYCDKLFDEYYISSQKYLKQLRLKCDYELLDKHRIMVVAQSTIDCNCAARVPHFEAREDRDPQMSLSGPFFEREYKLPVPIPFKGCNIETHYWVRNIVIRGDNLNKSLAVVATYTKSCDGVKKDIKFTVYGENSNLEDLKPPQSTQNNVYDPMRQHYNTGKKGSKGKADEDDEIVYISYNKDFGGVSTGKNALVIVPGSNYTDMMGLYCGIKIK